MAAFQSLGMETPDCDLKALRRLCSLVNRRFFRAHPAVEVGSWAGRTALVMAEAMKDRPIICVDTWLGSPSDLSGLVVEKLGQINVFRAFCQNVGDRLFKQIYPFVGSSEQAAASLTGERRFCLVFIDGEHTYEACKADIEAWSPWIKPRGILCGHDYGLKFPGVPRAVDEAGGKPIEGSTVWSLEI